MQRGNRIFDGLCHRVNIGLFRKRFAADDGSDSGFNSGEILVFVSVQLVRLGDGRVNLAVIRALELQRGNRIFNGLCHRVNFGLFSDVLVTDNGIDSRFYCGEILVVILLQSICLGEGCIDLGVVGVFVFQCGNRVFDILCHRVNIGLFRKRLAADDGVDRGFNSGEIIVFVTVQRVCLGNGCVNLAVIRGFDRQRGRTTVLHKCVAQQLCHGSVFKFFCRLLLGTFRLFCRSTFSVEAVWGEDLTLECGRISP